MVGTYVRQRIHLVWGTRQRRPWLDRPWRTRLFARVGAVIRGEGGMLLCAGGGPDHLHLYLEFPASVALSGLVNVIKSSSSRWIHQTYAHRHDFHWQSGYAAISVNPKDDRALQDYIRNQEYFHRERSFADEYVAILNEHRISYDPRGLLE
jgi:REP element-mobilizing transposase RayT